MRLVLDRRVRVLAGGRVLLGSDPGRLVRLRSADALPALLAAGARQLLDGGLAHPRPEPAADPPVTVVVPVRDRPGELDRCLTALGGAHPVLVVDDGSDDPRAVAEVCAHHGARLLRLPVNRGPAAARNTGLQATGSPLVAFLDSDCVPPRDWVAQLAGHLTDSAVGAVAPRVRGLDGGSVLARYAHARGPLDLGPDEAQVRPGTRVAYVPTAALLVRRAALDATGGFDARLRVGEDVDLVWRLHDAGWSVRYDPRTVVAHAEPERWRAWLVRRHRYGTSAAPLAGRHGARLAPLVLPPWPVAAWLLLCSGHPLPALAAAGVPAARLVARLRAAQVPAPEAVRAAVSVVGEGVLSVGAGLGGAGTAVTGPVLLAALLPRRTRSTALSVLLAPPLLDALRRRPRLDPLRWTALRLLDDAAYASGVWRGCWSARSLAAVRPRRSRPS